MRVAFKGLRTAPWSVDAASGHQGVAWYLRDGRLPQTPSREGRSPVVRPGCLGQDLACPELLVGWESSTRSLGGAGPQGSAMGRCVCGVGVGRQPRLLGAATRGRSKHVR